METKTKAIIALIVGVLAISIAVPITGRVLAAGEGERAVTTETVTDEDGASQGDVPGDDARGETPQAQRATADEDVFSECAGKSWASANGSLLQLTDALYVEKSTEGQVYLLSVSGHTETHAGDQTLIRITGTDEAAKEDAVLTLIYDESARPARLASDDFRFASEYFESASTEAFAVEGIDERVLGIVGGTAADIEDALAAYARAHIPQASKAVFDGEIYLDTKRGTAGLTFHADDPASTILTLTCANGTYAVSG